LAIATEHAKVMNGMITISDPPDNNSSGLRFTFTIPVESDIS
jgi:hypothetical protein